MGWSAGIWLHGKLSLSGLRFMPSPGICYISVVVIVECGASSGRVLTVDATAFKQCYKFFIGQFLVEVCTIGSLKYDT